MFTFRAARKFIGFRIQLVVEDSAAEASAEVVAGAFEAAPKPRLCVARTFLSVHSRIPAKRG